MKIKEVLSKEITKKILCVVLVLAVGLLSMTVISKFATSADSYKSTIESIDDKKAVVMGVTATAATASAALAAFPGDLTTPVANQIMELSSYLLIVVCVLVLEKSLLTTLGYLSFNILVPIACVLFGINAFAKKRDLKIIAFKIIAFALVIVLIIPFSMKISDLIYEANQATVEQVITDLDETVTEDESSEESWIHKMLGKVKEGVADAGEKAKDILNGFIDAIALFIISYCALPIIIVLVVIWFINVMFKLNVPSPNINIKRIGAKNNKKEELQIEEKQFD